jgi:hypothetical protein
MIRRIALAWLMAAMALSIAPTVGARSSPASVPDSVRAPDGNMLLFKTIGAGVQIYTCTAAATGPEPYTWTFTAPQAALWTDGGDPAGSHSAGPRWVGNDGSAVNGETVGRADAPEASAIPWLLLRATANDGAGVFSGVTYIQRLETVGGIAPADGCDESAAGSRRAVPYTAVYAFYARAAG